MMKAKPRYLVLIKGKERYFFQYRCGNEKSLVFRLMDYAQDDSCNLSMREVARLIFMIKRQKEKQSSNRYLIRYFHA